MKKQEKEIKTEVDTKIKKQNEQMKKQKKQ